MFTGLCIQIGGRLGPLRSLDIYTDLVEVLVRTGRADHDVVPARYDPHRVGLHVPTFKRLAREVDLDGLGLSGVEADTCEAAQGFQRSVGVGGVAHIGLDDLHAVPLSRIADLDGDLVAGGIVCRRADLKGGVAQTIAEGEQGCALEIAVGAVGHVVVVERRQLAVVLIEGDRQLAAGVVIAEKNVGHGRASLLAGIPGLQDGIAGLQLGGKGHGAAAAVDQHDFLAGLMERLEEIALDGRQLNAGAVAVVEAYLRDLGFLALEIGRYAADEHHGAGIPDRVRHLGDGEMPDPGHVKAQGGAGAELDIIQPDVIGGAGLDLELGLLEPHLIHIVLHGKRVAVDDQAHPAVVEASYG